MNAPEQSTALTVQARASIALGAAEREKKLVVLAKQSREIVAITNAAGYQQCHGARMSLKRARLEIESQGEIAREDAKDFAKAVIAEQKRLVAIVEPEELRLQAIQKAHDDRIEAEKQAKIDAERERIAKIQAGIDEIKQYVLDAAGRSSANIAMLMDELDARGNGVWAHEFQDVAEQAKVATMNKLNAMHAAAVEQEAEQARIAAERIELDRRKAEQAELERKTEAERQERAREEKKLMDEAIARRVEEDRLAREQRERAERESRERIAEQERVAAEAREREESRIRAEREALDREKADREAAERGLREIEERRIAEERATQERAARVESDRLEAEHREAARKDAERMEIVDLMRLLRDKIVNLKEYAKVVKAINAVLEKQPETA